MSKKKLQPAKPVKAKKPNYQQLKNCLAECEKKMIRRSREAWETKRELLSVQRQLIARELSAHYGKIALEHMLNDMADQKVELQELRDRVDADCPF